MKLLLDTHVFLWWLFDDLRLSATVRGLLADRTNDVWVSAASAWEISTKYRLGKLPCAATLIQDLSGYVERAGFADLPITLAHAHMAGQWPQPHRDPFDRMLAAQSRIEQVALVTCDAELKQFGVTLVW